MSSARNATCKRIAYRSVASTVINVLDGKVKGGLIRKNDRRLACIIHRRCNIQTQSLSEVVE
jgi:hypothetical protein